MTGFVDLHCHWICEIDDGARNIDEGLDMLRALKRLGFSHVAATPHTRPGMFDNNASTLREAYLRMQACVPEGDEYPETSLASEHFFDDSVIRAIHAGEALPYRPGFDPHESSRHGGAILIEFLDLPPPAILDQQLFLLKRAGYLPVIAHPERYRSVWSHPDRLLSVVEQGTVALLDTAALVGKYGRRARASAELLLEQEAYDAACSDAHRPADVELLQRGMEWIEKRYGREELSVLFQEGPTALLSGQHPNTVS